MPVPKPDSFALLFLSVLQQSEVQYVARYFLHFSTALNSPSLLPNWKSSRIRTGSVLLPCPVRRSGRPSSPRRRVPTRRCPAIRSGVWWRKSLNWRSRACSLRGRSRDTNPMLRVRSMRRHRPFFMSFRLSFSDVVNEKSINEVSDVLFYQELEN